MLRNKNFFAIIVIGILAEIQVSNAEDNLVVGEISTIKEVPHMVQIWEEGYFRCSGALVQDRFVVTTTTCVFGYKESDLSVKVGASVISEKGKMFKVKKLYTPEDYNRKLHNMDVAVLELTNSVQKTTKTRSIKLCNESMDTGTDITVTGWGVQTTYDTEPIKLRTVKVEVEDKSKCQASSPVQRVLTKTLLCATSASEHGLCLRTASGVAVSKNRLCALVSFDVGCKSVPGVYTDVNKVKEFIKSVIKN